jgi:hypothetical protein
VLQTCWNCIICCVWKHIHCVVTVKCKAYGMCLNLQYQCCCSQHSIAMSKNTTSDVVPNWLFKQHAANCELWIQQCVCFATLVAPQLVLQIQPHAPICKMCDTIVCLNLPWCVTKLYCNSKNTCMFTMSEHMSCVCSHLQYYAACNNLNIANWTHTFCIIHIIYACFEFAIPVLVQQHWCCTFKNMVLICKPSFV